MPSSEYKFTEIQERWLQALESGEYQQGEGSLKRGQLYCCLGVGAAVCDIPDHELERRGDLGDGNLPELGVTERLGLLDGGGGLKKPYEVLDEEDGELVIEADSLVYFNDGLHWDFKKIARFIRENPELVFVEKEEGNG